MEDKEREACLQAALLAADKAGAILLDFVGRHDVREKGRFDLVTDADVAAQAAIQELLLGTFPHHQFLGEEQDVSLRPSALVLPTWIVDPLDGTTNYAHGLPIYATSIGLAVDGRFEVAVIHDPSRHETFHAARGQGAYLNGKRLQVSRVTTLDQALLAVGFPTEPSKHRVMMRSWEHFSARTQSLRRTGSTALNLAYVACGRHDGSWTTQAHVWDAAAGILLVEEAGGTISRMDGSPYDWQELDVLASNRALHPILLQELTSALA